MATISENVVPATGLEQDPESSLIYKEVGYCGKNWLQLTVTTCRFPGIRLV